MANNNQGKAMKSSGILYFAKQKNVIFVVSFDPIKIWISWALQNDRQNLSFVKAVVGKKMARNGLKMANS